MSPDAMLPTSDTVRRLLAIEDAAPDVLYETLPGSDLPLWPRVRMFFANALAAEELGSTGVASSPSRGAAYVRLGRSLLPSRHDAAGLRGSARLVCIASGVTTAVSDSIETNWLVGDIAEALGDRAALLQWSPHRPGTRPAFPRTRSLDPTSARADLRAYREGLTPGTAEAIDRLIGRYAEQFSGAISPERVASISASTRYQERRAPLLRSALLRIIDRLDPHTVILEDASYGHRGDLIHALSAASRQVVEPQHGWIGPSHAAYNFGAVFEDARMRSQLPSELLTFGRFWSTGIRHPARTTEVGKPHLARNAAEAPRRSDRPRTAMVASSIADPQTTIRFLHSLQERLPHWTLRFRPHPSERATLAERYPGLTQRPGIEIDPHDDLYMSLRECRAVIGVASTVLFEAAEFECDVIVRRSPFTEYYVGGIFGPAYGDDDVDAMAARLDEDRYAAPDAQLWASDALARVREWAEARLR